jgi:ferredoxin
MDRHLQGKRFEEDYTVEELEGIYSDIDHSVTIPVNVAIKAEQRVLDLTSMEELLRDARRIALLDCGCRTSHHNCEAPLETCINLDHHADEAIAQGGNNARDATLEEALKSLKVSHEAGLVHLAYIMEGEDAPGLICSCCPCCCHTLAGLLRFGLAPHILKSDQVSETDVGACTACGVCEERCPFGARRMSDGELLYDEDQCFGCGLCVSTCPMGAIRLVEKNRARQ